MIDGILLKVVQQAGRAHVVVRGRPGAGRSTVLRAAADALLAAGVVVTHPMRSGAVRVTNGHDDAPVVVVVDVLDALDDERAATLRRALQTCPAWLLGSLRAGNDLPGPLRIVDGRTPIVLPVEPLHVPQADALMRERLGDLPDRVARRELLRLADGRAGVCAELLDDLRDATDEGHRTADDPLPLGRRARQRVDSTLAGLGLPGRRLLERVAVAAAIPVTALAVDDLDTADHIARVGLIDADEVGRIRVSDPLVRALLLRDMPEVTRHLHARWLVERLAAAPVDAVPPWIAVPWRMLAGQPVTAAEMADAAVASPDPEIAQRLAEAATAGHGGRTARVVLARVSLVYGRTAEAEVLLDGMAVDSTVEPDGTTATPPLLAARAYLLSRQGQTTQAAALLETVGEGDDQALGRLVQLVVLGQLEEGLAVGRALLDSGYARRASLIMSWGRLLQGRVEAVDDLLRQEWSPADNPLEATGAVALRGHARLLGDLAELDELVRRWSPDTSPGRTAKWWLAAELAVARGRHRDALALLRAAEGEATDVDLFGMLPVVRWVAVRAAAEARVPWEQVGLDRPDVDEVPWGAPHAIPAAVARIIDHGVAGQADAAAELVMRFLATTGEAIMPAVLVLHAGLRAGIAAEELHPLAPVMGGGSRLLSTIVAHLEAAVAGDPQRLLAVARSYEQIGHVLFGAEARAQAGTAWLAQDLPPTPLLQLPAPVLTLRQRELVRQARNGVSNAELAARLTLSVRTVESHLSAAYRKMGISGRADLRSLPPDD